MGDFSALLSATDANNPTGKVVQILNPWPYAIGTVGPGQPFPNNDISAGLDPAAVKLAKNYLGVVKFFV
jgi:hypothetical protein